MQRSNINFKEIRKKVIYQNNSNSENIPQNPIHKVSFRGIKRNQQNSTSEVSCIGIKNEYASPLKIAFTKTKLLENSKQECSKFSILLESKGYSNCNSSRKENTEISFKTLCSSNKGSKARLNT